MSGWQSYIDNMMASKAVTNVGIFGLDGTPWAVSPALNVNYLSFIKAVNLCSFKIQLYNFLLY
jgi:hypothetical protein